MNYFAHGRHWIGEPYVLAGTAVPDWLSAVDRRVRVRSRQAAALVEDPDPRLAQLARGVLRHHHDDGWFHATAAFGELSAQLAAAVREALPPDEGMRTWLLGHILVELLLDAELIRRRPEELAAYYDAMAGVDPACVAAMVTRMAGRDAGQLAPFIFRFLREPFLPDYADDAKLAFRLGQVLGRVGLPPLPERFVEVLGPARRRVAQRADELLREGCEAEMRSPQI